MNMKYQQSGLYLERNESWIIEEILKHYFQIMQNMLFFIIPSFSLNQEYQKIRNIRREAEMKNRLTWMWEEF